MTDAPEDLKSHRLRVIARTGLGPLSFGIAPDDAHNTTGGYHVGRSQLAKIGKFRTPVSGFVGSSTQDYSARLLRDRMGLDESSSATDVGDSWSAAAGGRAAWLRWNNLLYLEMRDRPQNLPALRAVNISLDGRKKQRYDQEHRDQGLISSTDTVDYHTHLEYYRDTEGTPGRALTLARIEQLINAAITNTPPAPVGEEGDDVTTTTFATDNTRFYVLEGGTARIVDQADMKDAAYLAKQRGHEVISPAKEVTEEWKLFDSAGTKIMVRLGYKPGPYPAVPGSPDPAVIVAAVVDAVTKLPAAGGLSKADVTAAVKDALREGSG